MEIDLCRIALKCLDTGEKSDVHVKMSVQEMGPHEVRATFSFGHEDYPDLHSTGADGYQAIYLGILYIVNGNIKLMRKYHEVAWGGEVEMREIIMEPIDAEMMR